MLNILTIDFEEWYDAEYVKEKTPGNHREQAAKDLNKTLHLLSEYNVTTTFFVVGELAEKHPDLVERVRDDGHEVAFHGYYHEPLWKKSPEILQSEIVRFKNVVREKCIGFRAPSFSLSNATRWALEVLERNGYKYDSSVFPTKTPLYGVWGAPLQPYKPSHDDITVEDKNNKIWEFPLLVYRAIGLRIPVGGGFYLRFFPVNLLIRALEKANRNGCPAVVYLHTWELNPETPRLKLGLYRSFVTYHNLEETRARLERILSGFQFTSISNYMEKAGLH